MDKPGGKTLEILPQISVSEILGLVELLNSKGGREDIYKLASELQMEFGETLAVIRAAELLGLVHTPGGDVEVGAVGEKISQAGISDRKSIINDQLMNIPLFKTVVDYLNEKDDRKALRDEVLEKLAELIPNENAEQTFTMLVQWGRYAEL
ncbi:MAG: hypothetical protein RJB38_1293, partial [Pseudomonadota bacterium]